MTQIQIFDREKSNDQLGVSFRFQQKGPEAELVDWFIDELYSVKLPSNFNMTIFREPRIESGFPDLVVVVWHKPTAKRWKRERANIGKRDLQILHYLLNSGPKTTTEIRKVFKTTIAQSLSRLEAADLTWQQGQKWKTKSLSRSFAVREIIAIEAKVSEWKTALEQALHNTWFACSSYILVPHIPKHSELSSLADSFGVGVLSRRKAEIPLPSQETSLEPRSYASWLFNEWAWRGQFLEKGFEESK